MQTLSWDRATQKCAVGSSWGRRDEAGGLDRGQNKSSTLTISKLSNQKKRQKKTKQIQINIINTSHYFCDFKMWEFCASVGFWFSLCRVLDYVSSCIILSCVGVIIVDRCCLWLMSITTRWNKLAESESDRKFQKTQNLKGEITNFIEEVQFICHEENNCDLITAVEDVRCIQGECSIRHDQSWRATSGHVELCCFKFGFIVTSLVSQQMVCCCCCWTLSTNTWQLIGWTICLSPADFYRSDQRWGESVHQQNQHLQPAAAPRTSTSAWKPDRIGSRMISKIQKCNDKSPGFPFNI